MSKQPVDAPRHDTMQRLRDYARDADAFRRRGQHASFMRTLRRSTLAGLVPLAAAATTADAQCNPAYGGFLLTINGNSQIDVPVGQGTSDVLKIAFLDTTLGPIQYRSFVVSGGLDVNALSTNLFVVNKLASGVPVTVGSGVGPNGAFLCRATASGTSLNTLGGEFCAGSGSGFIGLQHADGRLGWLELNVVVMSVSSVFVDIGQSRLNTPPGGTVQTGDCSIQLPVELTTFAAIHTDEGVTLQWETASELNNAGFEVQRADAAGSFAKIAFVGGNGTTDEPQRYSFLDRSATPNVRYRYRLKQVDFDGATFFSHVVEVFTEDPSQIALSEFYPSTSSNGFVRLNVDLADGAAAGIEVFDVRGALVAVNGDYLNAGRNRVTVETDALAVGPHFAKIRIGDRVYYRRFVVAR